jgi:hypothetical protein
MLMDMPRILTLTAVLCMTSPLAAVADTRADVNGDGRTDGADLELMRTLFFGTDARADLDGDGRVDFADLALLKAAQPGAPRVDLPPGGVEIPPPAPSVYLLPETQAVTVGDPVAVDIYWDFTGEAALGGGTDFTWDPSAFSLLSIVFDDNFGTGPGQFDPAFTRCDNENCSGPGFIDGLATGNFSGLGDPGPIYIATLTFDALRTGTFSITAAEDDGVIAGPFVSAITFLPYPDIQFAGAAVEIQPGPPEPRINVTPLDIDFPDTVPGGTSSAPVRVDNVGELPLTISDVSPPLPPFALSADGCTGLVLQPGQGCDLTLDFSPTLVGQFASFILISSDDPDQPEVQVTMSGSGVILPVPDIAGPRVVGFTAVRVGQTARNNLIVRNNGNGNLVIGQIGIANPLEPPFLIDFDNCSGDTLAPANTCSILLHFTPTEAGLATDDLDIPSNDPDTPSLVVSVRGTGEPRIALSSSGIQADAGRCINRATGQTITVPLGGGTTLPCEGGGLTADSGDALKLFMRGVADSATALTGRGLGMTVDRVRCVDETTGQSVTINPPGPGIDWNCVGWGLIVTPGDTVSMTVFGAAL